MILDALLLATLGLFIAWWVAYAILRAPLPDRGWFPAHRLTTGAVIRIRGHQPVLADRAVKAALDPDEVVEVVMWPKEGGK